jgi:hypothetical protein
LEHAVAIKMNPKPHIIEFDGGLLQRGFWLYVWEIRPPNRRKPLYYVGRTGDNPSLNAQSPFNRMGQHLGAGVARQLSNHLEHHSVKREECSFRLVAYGPILEEVKTKKLFRERRDVIAALEKALADAMLASGYKVMNKVYNRQSVNSKLFADVRAEFAKPFPKLRE